MESIKHPRFTDEYLINKLKELSLLLGRPPKYWDLKGVDKPKGFPSRSTYEKYFGTWNNAARAAGFPLGVKGNKSGKLPISDDILISRLQDLFAEMGRPVGRDELKSLSKQGKSFSPSAYETHFGTWNNALKVAGLPPRDPSFTKGSDAAKEWGQRMARMRKKVVLKNPFANLRMRFEVFRRDNFTCQYCGRTPQDGAKLIVDHVLAVANGGETRLDNLTTSCFECNAGKSCLLLNGQQKMATERLGSQ
jgi:hypothetical protein